MSQWTFYGSGSRKEGRSRNGFDWHTRNRVQGSAPESSMGPASAVDLHASFQALIDVSTKSRVFSLKAF